ncbi:MAG: DUF4127 family protein, partial [Vulcanimicrobiaceae bacterium]
VVAGAAVAVFALGATVRAAPTGPAPRPIAFVPIDDRPVTYQLPILLGQIAGQPVLTPPRSTIGHYLDPGKPDAILDWLDSSATDNVAAVVASSDMIVYGGLVASRLPGLPVYDGYARLRRLGALAAARPNRFMSVFGTVMRLAPTGIAKIGPAEDYYATGQTVNEIAAYANLPDPPATAQERARAAHLRALITPKILDEYLGARARNRDVDLFILQLAAEGDFAHVILGQDDAGPVGLHIKDLQALMTARERFGVEDQTSIEPGADELGMVLVSEVMARTVHWTPRIRVVYSRPDGGAMQDRIEYVPIDVTVSRLIHACGGERVDGDADLTLYVRVAPTGEPEEASFVDQIVADVDAGKPVTIADLSFLYGPTPSQQQQQLTLDLIARHVAGRVDGYASWNTTANTVGTSLATAVAAGAGRRAGRLNERALAQFLLDRYADDFAFHQFVRPVINADLRAEHVDTTYLVNGALAQGDQQNRELLWPQALDLLREIFPDWEDAGLTITLPWERTFETQLDVRLR